MPWASSPHCGKRDGGSLSLPSIPFKERSSVSPQSDWIVFSSTRRPGGAEEGQTTDPVTGIEVWRWGSLWRAEPPARCRARPLPPTLSAPLPTLWSAPPPRPRSALIKYSPCYCCGPNLLPSLLLASAVWLPLLSWLVVMDKLSWLTVLILDTSLTVWSFSRVLFFIRQKGMFLLFDLSSQPHGYGPFHRSRHGCTNALLLLNFEFVLVGWSRIRMSRLLGFCWVVWFWHQL